MCEKRRTFGFFTSLSAQDSSLDRSTISDGLIWVDTLARFLAVEEIPQQFLDLGNPGASTNKDNFVNLAFLQTSIFHGLLNRAHGLPEQIVVQFLKTSSGKRLGEIHSVKEGLNFYSDLVLTTQSSLSTLTLPPQLSECPVVLADVLAVLLLDQLNEVIHDSVIKILTCSRKTNT